MVGPRRPLRHLAWLGVAAVASFGFALDVVAVGAAFSQASALHGTWSLGRSDTKGLAHLGLRYVWREHSNSQWGRAIPLARLEGLDANAFESQDGPVAFRVVRDAGTIVCRGTAGRGEGAGTFDLELDPAFPAALEKRGVGRPTTEEQMRLALADAGFGLIDALARQEYPKPDVDWMIRLGEHGAREEFVDGLAKEGYRLQTLTRLVQARDHGVDPHFIRSMREAGYKSLTYDQLLRARDHGADPTFIAEMRSLGMRDATLEEMIALRDHGVTADYIADLAEAGFDELPLRKVIRARDHGLSGSKAKRGRAALGDDATIDDVIAWTNRGGR